MIPCKWAEPCLFFEDMAMVKDDNDKYGYIDKMGNIIIPCKWQGAVRFVNGYAHVYDEKASEFVIDKTGRIISEVKFHLYYCPETGLYGYKNQFDKIVIPPKWDLIGQFSEGLALVRGKNN